MQSIRIREHQFKNNNGIGLGNQRYRYKKNEKIKRKKCLKRRSRTDFSFHWLNDHFTFYYYVEFYLYVIQPKLASGRKYSDPRGSETLHSRARLNRSIIHKILFVLIFLEFCTFSIWQAHGIFQRLMTKKPKVSVPS